MSLPRGHRPVTLPTPSGAPLSLSSAAVPFIGVIHVAGLGHRYWPAGQANDVQVAGLRGSEGPGEVPAGLVASPSLPWTRTIATGMWVGPRMTPRVATGQHCRGATSPSWERVRVQSGRGGPAAIARPGDVPPDAPPPGRPRATRSSWSSGPARLRRRQLSYGPAIPERPARGRRPVAQTSRRSRTNHPCTR